MFSKQTPNTPPQPQGAAPQPPRADAAPTAAPTPDTTPRPAVPKAQKLASLIASDMTLEGNISGGGEIQVDGVIKGDVRVERVTVGDGGQVDGGIYAEAVEVRGKVSGSITAKQVRLYGNCHVDGDITHEQLAMETGAFFQGRSLRLQRPAAVQPQPAAPVAPPKPVEASASHAPKENGNAAGKAAPAA